MTKSRKVKRVHKSMKHIGIICALFTAIQAVIWIALTLTGIICIAGASCGTGKLKDSFHFIYLDIHSSSSPSTLSPPIVFLILLILYFCLSVIWLIASICVIRHFRRWCNYGRIKRAGRKWLIITAIVCIVDYIVFIIFLIDVIMIINKNDPGAQASPKFYYNNVSPMLDTRHNGNNLIDIIQTRLKNMEKHNPNIFSLNNVENKATDDILNTDLQKKIWNTVPWPSKNKLKMKEKRASESKTCRY